MRFDYKGPKKYRWNMPIFDKNMCITERVESGLENVLSAYVEIAKMQSQKTDNNIENYEINRVYVLGSGARCNRIDSDLDLLLIVPRLDIGSANQIRTMMCLTFFTDRPKRDAIDVFVRDEDIYPERSSVNITDKVSGLINNYNRLLLIPEKIVS